MRKLWETYKAQAPDLEQVIAECAALCNMMDVTAFTTTTINGREYVLVATPHEY